MVKKNILQQLFDGKVYPSANIGVGNPELHTANWLAEDAKVQFAKKLLDSDREEFNKIYELYSNASGIYSYESFAHGFKLGVTLLHEALSDADGLTKHST